MPPRPKHSLAAGPPSTQRQFTDREDFFKSFQSALAGKLPDKHQVLVFYGVGGIGKTSLRRELQRLIEDQPDVMTAALDFDLPQYRDEETALFALRKELQHKYKVGFPTFDVAYAVYWQKSHPQTPMNKQNFPFLEDSVHLLDIIHLAKDLPFVGIAARLGVLTVKGSLLLKQWWEKRGHQELKGLAEMEPLDIAGRLPMYWASDVQEFLKEKNKTAIVFLDTYDSLTEAERMESKLREREAWVRELVAQLPEVLWVICGREQLRWEEADPEWGGALQQHLVGGLSDNDARQFLTGCGIDDPAIHGAIVTSSQGVPYFLDLAVDTWVEIKDRRKRQPVTEDFAHTRLETFDRFLRHLTHPEVETLKVLSVPRFWDYPLCEALVTKFQTGFSLTAFADLCRFSFISEGSAAGTYTMHQLMRQSLQEHQVPELRERVGTFLFDCYDVQLADVSPKDVTETHLRACIEANYHASRALEPERFCEWSERMYHAIDGGYRSGQYMLSLVQERYQSLAARLGPDHPLVVQALSEVGRRLVILGDGRSAEPILREALARAEKALGCDINPLVSTMVKLAIAYVQQAKFSEAESLYERAIAVLRSRSSPDQTFLAYVLVWSAILQWTQGRLAAADTLFHEAVATVRKALGQEPASSWLPVKDAMYRTWLPYARFCHAQGRLQEAESLYRDLLETAERASVPDSLYVGSQLNTLGCFLAEVGRYEEAEPLLRRALALFEEGLGACDPSVASGPMDSLADLYRRRGRLAESEMLHQQALKICEKTMGSEHPFASSAMYGIAEIRLAQGKLEEAEAMFQRALALREKGGAGPDTDTARVLDGLARLYEQTGRAAEAEAIRQRIKDINLTAGASSWQGPFMPAGQAAHDAPTKPSTRS